MILVENLHCPRNKSWDTKMKVLVIHRLDVDPLIEDDKMFAT